MNIKINVLNTNQYLKRRVLYVGVRAGLGAIEVSRLHMLLNGAMPVAWFKAENCYNLDRDKVEKWNTPDSFNFTINTRLLLANFIPISVILM